MVATLSLASRLPKAGGVAAGAREVHAAGWPGREAAPGVGSQVSVVSCLGLLAGEGFPKDEPLKGRKMSKVGLDSCGVLFSMFGAMLSDSNGPLRPSSHNWILENPFSAAKPCSLAPNQPFLTRGMVSKCEMSSGFLSNIKQGCRV